MNRYIDAEWLLGVAELSKGVIDVDDLYNAPSIDIVRCVECKYYNNDYTGEWCGRFRYPHGCRPDGFCSYGQRKESE